MMIYDLLCPLPPPHPKTVTAEKVGQSYQALHIPDEIVIPRPLITRHLAGELSPMPGTLEVSPDAARLTFTFDNGQAVYTWSRAASPFEPYVPSDFEDPQWFRLERWEGRS